MIEQIRKELFKMQDKEYGIFHSRLIPTIDPKTVIGVRTPELRKYAKQLSKNSDISIFLENVPHKYYDENQLHAFIISETKDFNICMEQIESFLPYVDNWATCDQMSPKVLKRHKQDLLKHIKVWLKSSEAYTIRFAAGMLMQHFLDDEFDPEYPKIMAEIRSEEYYVNMMTAWYFATALAKQYEHIIPFIEQRKLDKWTHNKAIQKAIESRRISFEQKEYLRGLKI